jgi:hypothetical protein
MPPALCNTTNTSRVYLGFPLQPQGSNSSLNEACQAIDSHNTQTMIQSPADRHNTHASFFPHNLPHALRLSHQPTSAPISRRKPILPSLSISHNRNHHTTLIPGNHQQPVSILFRPQAVVRAAVLLVFASTYSKENGASFADTGKLSPFPVTVTRRRYQPLPNELELETLTALNRPCYTIIA